MLPTLMSETSKLVHHIVLVLALVVKSRLNCYPLRAVERLPVIHLILLHVLDKPHKLRFSRAKEDIRRAGDVD